MGWRMPGLALNTTPHDADVESAPKGPPPPKPVLENVSWLVAANTITKPLWFIFLFVLARVLGPKAFGDFQLHLSMAFFVCLIMDLGIDQALIREAALDLRSAGAYVGTMGTVKLVLGLLAMIVALVVQAAVPGGASAGLLLLASFAQVEATLLLFVRTVFRAQERMEYEAYSTVVEKSLIAVLALGTVLALASVPAVFIAMAVANALSILYCIHLARKLLPLRVLRFRPAVIGPMLRTAFPYALMGVFVLVNTRSDTLILARFRGAYDVGLYQGAFRYIEFLIYLPALFVTPLFPRLSRLLVSSLPEAQYLVRQVFKWLIPVALVLSLLLSSASSQVVILLLGEQYVQSIPFFRAMVWLVPPVTATFLFGTVLAASGRQSTATLFSGIAAALNVAINLFLVPQKGAQGAVIAALASNTCQAVLTMIFGLRIIRGGEMRSVFVSLSAAVGAAGAAWLAVGLVLHAEPLVCAILANAVFIALLVKSGFYTWRDFRELWLRLLLLLPSRRVAAPGDSSTRH